MKLREHPLFTRKSGYCSWPPQWQAILNENDTVVGEVGILEDVSMNDLIANKGFLAMRHSGHRYIAVLAFDDASFANQIYSILILNMERSIKEIGDLDLSHLL